MKKRIFMLILLGIAGLFTGCQTHDPEHSHLSWSQPASWESTPMGMGGVGF